MARKNLLASVTASIKGDTAPAEVSEARADYTKRGASRSMLQSLDEMAEASLRMIGGETVVSLDPNLLDGSFIADRIGEQADDFEALKEAIRKSGQSTPILVRPHPDATGQYQIIFGHRRAKAARELGIQVRAVIKQMADIEHVIAQGQENTARADLTFIEKALFARRLLDRGMTKEVAKSALTVDDTLLSRMLSVVETVPETVLEAIGAGKGIGRDRWEELKKLVLIPANTSKAVEFVASEEFKDAQGRGEGFNQLLAHLKVKAKKPKRAGSSAAADAWAPENKAVIIASKSKPKGYSLEFTEKDAKPFGEFIRSQLDDLYEAFRKSEKKPGD
ncbi:plasmid partitioning protein RepB [Pseudorhizobium flavum]|uniref:plasmid partitioning protein RepB n=1 Tax=Pseudorhizobium flavum TaxID=1335061 RepID=UPI00377033EB